MIEVSHLDRYFGDYLAVRDVSFSVAEGQVMGFLGPNGAGKTTTMRCLTGFLPPTSGAVRIDGFDVVENPHEIKKRIGYLPETPPLYGDMLVEDYLRFVADLKSVDGARRNGLVEHAMALCGLSDVKGRLIRNLSKGYRQRVGIAQAIVHEPKVVILDEPTSGLDPNQVIEVRSVISDLAKDRTVILSTHILSEVEKTCQLVTIINEGRIVASDTVTRLLQGADVRRLRLSFAKDAPGAAEEILAVTGVKSASFAGDSRKELQVETELDPDPRAEIARFAVEKGYGLLEFRAASESLESIFRRLTADEPQAEGSAAAGGAPEAPASAAEPAAPEGMN